ncbi:MAG: DNA polymerase III subunit delta [Chloroflexi bacterium]|nr:DNA polymerase III subunit delta [Chloroflexota bacterium]
MTPTFYILHGEDDFALAEHVQSLKEKLGDPTMALLNTTEFDGRTVTLAELRSATDALPFLSDRRMVIVEGLLSRLSGKGDEAEEGEEEAPPAALKEFRDALAEYLPHVPPTTRLVFVERKTLPERHKFLNLVAKSGGVGYARRFDPPKEGELPGWIQKRAKAAGGEFTRDGAQALAAAVGDEMRLLDNEIEKLLTYVDRARPVDVPDVETLTPYAGEVKIFDMVDAMGARQGKAAVQLLHRLLDQPSQYPLAVFAMIVRQFRLLLQTRELLDEGIPAAGIAGTLGLHPFVAGKVAEQCRKFSIEELDSIFRKLLDIDLVIKSSQVDAGLALETFVANPSGWRMGVGD